MPRKGYKQKLAHRQKKNERIREWYRSAQAAIQERAIHRRKQKPPPQPTPIPPSASHIRSLPFQRWAVYSFNQEGHYYYKREEAATLPLLLKLIARLDLEPPLWAFVKSGHTQDELTIMPIRIPEIAIRALGHRFQTLKLKGREPHGPTN